MRCYICNTDRYVKTDPRDGADICQECLDKVDDALLEYGIEDTDDMFNRRKEKQHESLPREKD